jgi:hypothetical protein
MFIYIYIYIHIYIYIYIDTDDSISVIKIEGEPSKKIEKIEINSEIKGSAIDGMKAFWNAIQLNETAPGMIIIIHI